jgi:hypothetical protein
MTTTRVLIEKDGISRRLLKLEASPDGSILVFLDLDATPAVSPYKSVDGIFEPLSIVSGGKPKSYTKVSCHTTGVVHTYSRGERESSIFIDPLYCLVEPHWLSTLSVPKVERCDNFDPQKHKQHLKCIIDCNDRNERITLAIVISPLGHVNLPGQLLSLDYELYSIRLCQDRLPIAPPSTDHVVAASPSVGKYDRAQVGKVWAELLFHQKRTGTEINLFWEKGVYTLLTAVPMRVAPNLKITFIRNELTFEQIPFEGLEAPTHKLRFYIKDTGGRNKVDDLRPCIESIELDAEMH